MEFYFTEKIVEIMAFGGNWIELKVLMLDQEVQIWKEGYQRVFFSYVELRFNFYILIYICVFIW